MLSFVIPALNEAESIERCVASVGAHMPEGVAFEVIVADNGSTDGTPRIASEAGARIVHSTAKTIGAVRNDGARTANGEVLVFIDADCALTNAWGRAVEGVLEILGSGGALCAGSQVFPPEGERVFLWTYWFLPFVSQESASHIGSANMMCSRNTFDSIEGFDETLETGEDYDFCARLLAVGGRLLNLPELRVEHYGFPRTWSSFFRRERWHGAGDVVSLSGFLGSKVALASVCFVVTGLGGVGLIAAGFTLLGAVLLGLSFLVVFGSSLAKFRHAGARVVLVNTAILPVYFTARALSVVDGLLGRDARRRAVRGTSAQG